MCFYTLLLAQLFILQTDNSARERLGKKILAAREIGENVSTKIERGGRGDFESEGERETCSRIKMAKNAVFLALPFLCLSRGRLNIA